MVILLKLPDSYSPVIPHLLTFHFLHILLLDLEKIKICRCQHRITENKQIL